MKRQLSEAPSAPLCPLLQFLSSFPVTRKDFISLLTHPAVLPARSGRGWSPGELPGSFSETPSSLLPPWLHAASAWMCCFCPRCLQGWFLQESFSVPQSQGYLKSSGWDQRSGCSFFFLWRRYLWDVLCAAVDLQKDLHLVPSSRNLSMPGCSSWSCTSDLAHPELPCCAITPPPSRPAALPCSDL